MTTEKTAAAAIESHAPFYWGAAFAFLITAFLVVMLAGIAHSETPNLWWTIRGAMLCTTIAEIGALAVLNKPSEEDEFGNAAFVTIVAVGAAFVGGLGALLLVPPLAEGWMAVMDRQATLLLWAMLPASFVVSCAQLRVRVAPWWRQKTITLSAAWQGASWFIALVWAGIGTAFVLKGGLWPLVVLIQTTIVWFGTYFSESLTKVF